MPTEAYPIRFDPHADSVLARWVLEHPYLQWLPGSGECPTLTYQVRSRVSPKVKTYKCHILGVLGRGGFGIVFHARHDELGELAIKMPRQLMTNSTGDAFERKGERDLDRAIQRAASRVKAPVGDDTRRDFLQQCESRLDEMCELRTRSLNQEIVDRFRREGNMLERIDHPHVVKVYDVGEVGRWDDADAPNPTWRALGECIVMQYLVGRKAKELIDSQRQEDLQEDLPTILKFAVQTALGASAIHDHGSPHRDLSWFNVVVLKGCGSAMIVDLGNVMGKTRDVSFDLEKQDGWTFGIPGLVAPEQREMYPHPQSDQFSLGVMLYYWLTGRFPYHPGTYNPNGPGHVLEVDELCETLASGWTPQSQAALKEMSLAIMKAIQHRPADRHASMRDFAAQLEGILIDLGGSGRPNMADQELTPVGNFLQDLREASIEEVAAQRAGCCAILLSYVRQCRRQMSRSINNLVAVVEDILSGSDDLDSLKALLERLARAIDEKMKALMLVLREIDQMFQDIGPKPQSAMFARELRSLIERSIDAANVLYSSVYDMQGSLRKSASTVVLTLAKDETTLENKYVVLRELVRKTHADLVSCDFEFAVYAVRLKRLIRGTPRDPAVKNVPPPKLQAQAARRKASPPKKPEETP